MLTYCCAPTAHEIFFTLSVLPTYSPYGALNVFTHSVLPTYCPDGAMNIFAHAMYHCHSHEPIA